MHATRLHRVRVCFIEKSKHASSREQITRAYELTELHKDDSADNKESATAFADEMDREVTWPPVRLLLHHAGL